MRNATLLVEGDGYGALFEICGVGVGSEHEGRCYEDEEEGFDCCEHFCWGVGLGPSVRYSDMGGVERD